MIIYLFFELTNIGAVVIIRHRIIAQIMNDGTKYQALYPVEYTITGVPSGAYDPKNITPDRTAAIYLTNVPINEPITMYTFPEVLFPFTKLFFTCLLTSPANPTPANAKI